MNSRSVFALAYRLVVALVALIGVTGHLVQRLAKHPPEWSIPRSILDYLSYYTIQTNLLVVTWLAIAILYWRRESEHPILRPKIKGAFTLYISATFIIYAILLAGLWEPEGADLYLSIISHYITPIAFMIDWLLFEKRGTYQWKYALQWLVYPFGYLGYSLVYGGITGRYQYPFLNLPVLGWGGLTIRVALLVVFFVALGCMYIAINKTLGRRRRMEAG